MVMLQTNGGTCLFCGKTTAAPDKEICRQCVRLAFDDDACSCDECVDHARGVLEHCRVNGYDGAEGGGDDV